MTDDFDLTPPADWQQASLSLSRAPSGAMEGCLTVADPTAPDGFRTFRIANWRKGASTPDVTVAEFQVTLRGPDPWLDAWLGRLGRKVSG